jgi:hypothetical protein
MHVDDLWSTPVSLDFWFHPAERVAAALTAAGLALDATLVRAPYPEEYASQRAYLLAHRPAANRLSSPQNGVSSDAQSLAVVHPHRRTLI